MFDIKGLTEATLASVGVVQGLYQQFLKENKGDKDVALSLTQITWFGIMQSARRADMDDLDRL